MVLYPIPRIPSFICPVRVHFPIVLDKEMLMEIDIFCIKLSVTYNIIRTIISIRTRVYLHSGNIPWVEKSTVGNSYQILKLTFQKGQILYESLKGTKLKQFKVYREKPTKVKDQKMI